MDANRLEQIRWLADEFGGIPERDALDLIAEVERLQGENEEFRDQVTGLLESLAAKSLEVMRLEGECATLRATLAAERYEEGAAPSERWSTTGTFSWFVYRKWNATKDGELQVYNNGIWETDSCYESMLAAMLHADKVDEVTS